MKNENEKQKNGLTRSQEREASRRLGRHVSPEKAFAAFAATTLCCVLPMLLGLRLWDRIPEIVETGLVGPSGQDDSMPRAVLVFGVPGLGLILNTIAHGQLWLHQKAERLPPAAVRLVGRWSIAPISLLLSSFWMLGAAGQERGWGAMLPCVLGLLVLLIGGQMFDCPRGSRWGLRIRNLQYSESRWSRVHRIGGACWMLAGLVTMGLYFALGTLPLWSLPPVLLLLLAPVAAAFLLKE